MTDQALSAVVPLVLDIFGKLFSRFHWTSLLAAAVIALMVWLWGRMREPGQTPASFRAFLFPREVWLHRSALLDYRFVAFDKLALGLTVAFGALLVQPGQVEAAARSAEWAVRNASEASLGVVVAYTAALLIVSDFFRYWAHRWMHASPFLWQFHKVHHSAETLVPVSQLRNHPVNGLVNLTRGAIAVPLVTGAFLLFFPGKLTAVSILGINAGRFAFDVAGAQLRHSHVWLSFGPLLSRIVISPAQHQIHHSSDPRHRNRNYGSQFAIWDWMFGTLYVPRGRETLRFGIGAAETERMQTIASLYLVPFRDAFALLRGQRRARRQQGGTRPSPALSGNCAAPIGA